MAKKKKKQSGLVYSPESVSTVKRQLKSFNWKRLGIILGSTAAAFAIFEGGFAIERELGLSFSIVYPVFYISATLLAAAIIFLNHGLSKGKFTPEMLRDDLERDEAVEICERLNSHKRLAKKLMLVFVPIVFAILLDFIYLFYGDMIVTFFRFLVPQ